MQAKEDLDYLYHSLKGDLDSKALLSSVLPLEHDVLEAQELEGHEREDKAR